MSGQRDEQITGRQVLDRRERPHPVGWGNVRLGGLRLVGRHQRPATGVAEQHDLLGSGLLPQPAHPDPDLGQRVVEQEVGLVPAETRVPAEETVTALGEEGSEVMLGEIHVVMGGDERGPWQRS